MLELLQASVVHCPRAARSRGGSANFGCVLPTLEATMRGENLEDWQKLCQQAAGERDPQRLMQLIQEIDRTLSEKEGKFVGRTHGKQVRAA